MTANTWESSLGERPPSRAFLPFSSPSRLLRKTSRPFLRRQTESHSDAISQYQHTPEPLRPSTAVTRPPSRWQNQPAASLSLSRLRSISWTSRNFQKSGKLSRLGAPRAISAWDPPALDRALEQCLLQEVLDVRLPSLALSSTPRSPSHQNSASKAKLHKYNSSISSTIQLHSSLEPQSTPKYLLLSDDGRILQYGLDGDADRMPERILELGVSSVAVASDDVPGKHWVLRIVQTSTDKTSRTRNVLKSLRPRLLSRATEKGHQTSDMLIVFDSTHVFNIWLTTVRKEIEILGGLEYRPDSRGLEEEMIRHDSSSNGNSVIGPRFPTAPFIFPLVARARSGSHSTNSSARGSITTKISFNQGQIRGSDTRSSVGTATDLDIFRESETSGAASNRTGTRSSYTDSIAAELSNSAKSASSASRPGSILYRRSDVELRSRRKKDFPQMILIKPDGRKRSASCSPALPSPAFPRTPTLAPDTVHEMVGKFVHEEQSSPRSSVGAMKMGDWLAAMIAGNQRTFDSATISEIQETTVPDTVAQRPHADEEVMHFENFEFSAETSEEITPCNDVHSESAAHTSSTSTAKDVVVQPDPPTHHLAPRRVSSLDFSKKLRSISYPTSLSADIAAAASPTLDAFPIPGSTNIYTQFLHVEGSAFVSGKSRKRLSLNVQKHLESLDGKSPQRSPAVSGLHFGTHFAGDGPFQKQSVQIAGESFDFPLAANAVSATLSSVTAPLTFTTPFRKQHMKRQQSMPSIIYRAAAPLSPPPSAPLPAVPGPVSVDNDMRSGHTRGRSTTRRPQPCWKENHGHVRSATIDCFNQTTPSPLAAHPPTSSEIKYARRISSISVPNSKAHSRLSSQKQTFSTASAIAAVAAQLQKMTTPLATSSSSA